MRGGGIGTANVMFALRAVIGVCDMKVEGIGFSFF
jgi:hypothetical protein